MKRESADDYIYVFIREFLICDVAQGLNGDSPILSKGNPPAESGSIQKNKSNAYSLQQT